MHLKKNHIYRTLRSSVNFTTWHKIYLNLVPYPQRLVFACYASGFLSFKSWWWKLHVITKKFSTILSLAVLNPHQGSSFSVLMSTLFLPYEGLWRVLRFWNSSNLAKVQENNIMPQLLQMFKRFLLWRNVPLRRAWKEIEQSIPMK